MKVAQQPPAESPLTSRFPLGKLVLPHRVLVVDDNRDAANSVATLLRAMGHVVVVAYDGSTALAYARDFHPQIALLDLVMPGMDGFDLARKLRNIDALKQMRIVALTGFAQDSYRDAAEAAGFEGRLLKPASADELGALLSPADAPDLKR